MSEKRYPKDVDALTGVVSTTDPRLTPVVLIGGDGSDGEPGPPGRDGAAGAAGTNGAAGAQGTPGVPLFLLEQGPEGEPGPPGRDGAAGAAGTNGAAGAQGSPGVPLFLLVEGDEGEQGPPGRDGVAGAAGTNGGLGPTGPTGSALDFILDPPEDDPPYAYDLSVSAPATGSGRTVRETSPTIVTPAIDAIVSQRPTVSDSSIVRDVMYWARRTLRSWIKNPAQTTYANQGMIAAPTVTTNTAAGSGDTLIRPCLTIDTTAVIGAFCEVITPTFNYIRRCWSPTLTVGVRLPGSALNVRHWIGISPQTLNAQASPTAIHIAAFYYDTGVHGTAFWRTYTCDATAATITTTTVAYTAAAEPMFRIEMDGGTANFYIDDVRVASHTTNLPGNTTNMGFLSTLTTLAAATTSQRVGSFNLLLT